MDRLRTPWGYLLGAEASDIFTRGSSWMNMLGEGSMGLIDTNVIIESTLGAYFENSTYGGLDTGLIKRNTEYLRRLSERMEKIRNRLSLHEQVGLELGPLESKLEGKLAGMSGQVKKDEIKDKALTHYLEAVHLLKKTVLGLPSYNPSDPALYEQVYTLIDYVDSVAHFVEGKSADKGIVAATLTEALVTPSKNEVVVISGDNGVKDLLASQVFILTNILEQNPFGNRIRLAGSNEGCTVSVCGYDHNKNQYDPSFSSHTPVNGLKTELLGKLIKGGSESIEPSELHRTLFANVKAIQKHLHLESIVSVAPLVVSVSPIVSAEFEWLRDSYAARSFKADLAVLGGAAVLEKLLKDENAALGIAQKIGDEQLSESIARNIATIYGAIRKQVETLTNVRATKIQSLEGSVATLIKNASIESANSIGDNARQIAELGSELIR